MDRHKTNLKCGRTHLEYKFAALLTPSLTFGDEFVWSEHANEATELLAACDGRRLHVNLQCST